MTPYPQCPLVSKARVVYIGGINSTGVKGWSIRCDGYNCTIPKQPSNMLVAYSARFLPNFVTGARDYLNECCYACLNCTKKIPDLVVGSSQGGAVAMSLVQHEWRGARLILLAPAWKTFGVKPIVPQNTIILHGKNDWLVSPSDSETLKRRNKCSLFKLDDGHALEHSTSAILKTVEYVSKAMGKHKSQEQIDKEWKAYKQACKEWQALNCTKMVVPNTSLTETVTWVRS